MDWSKAYRPERRADLGDIADAIREAVTVEQAITVYLPNVRVRNHRCPCPFHNGKDDNFSFTKGGYKCFVCGASGDVINFVKGVCELPTRFAAMQKINADFRLRLPIGESISAEQEATLARRRAEQERKRIIVDEWWAKYHDLMDKLIDCQRALENADPDSEQYAEAARNIDFIEYQLDSLPPEPR